MSGPILKREGKEGCESDREEGEGYRGRQGDRIEIGVTSAQPLQPQLRLAAA